VDDVISFGHQEKSRLSPDFSPISWFFLTSQFIENPVRDPKAELLF